MSERVLDSSILGAWWKHNQKSTDYIGAWWSNHTHTQREWGALICCNPPSGTLKALHGWVLSQQNKTGLMIQACQCMDGDWGLQDKKIHTQRWQPPSPAKPYWYKRLLWIWFAPIKDMTLKGCRLCLSKSSLVKTETEVHQMMLYFIYATGVMELYRVVWLAAAGFISLVWL